MSVWHGDHGTTGSDGNEIKTTGGELKIGDGAFTIRRLKGVSVGYSGKDKPVVVGAEGDHVEIEVREAPKGTRFKLVRADGSGLKEAEN